MADPSPPPPPAITVQPSWLQAAMDGLVHAVLTLAAIYFLAARPSPAPPAPPAPIPAPDPAPPPPGPVPTPTPRPQPAPTAVQAAAIDAYRNEPNALSATADRLDKGTLALGPDVIARAIASYRATRAKALADALAIDGGSAGDVAGRLRAAADAMRSQLAPAAKGGPR